MKIVFFGTPEFAIPSLDLIIKSDYSLLSVITNIYKKSGRGLIKKASPVKKFCDKNSINCLVCDDFKNPKIFNYLKNLKADLFIVVAFKILPEEIINLPKYGSINIHPSLLPKYRGSSPIQHAILNGDTNTGITIFKLNKKIDSGDIIIQESYSIEDNIIFSDLYMKLAKFGSQLLLESVKLIKNNNINYSSQSKENISYACKISTNDCRIDWDNSAYDINNKIRAFSHVPGAFTFLNNKKVKILSSSIYLNYIGNLKKAQCIYYKNELLIGTKDYPIAIDFIQFEGKKMITAKDFTNSNFFLNNKIIYFE